jgi:hypothetical protein
MIFSMVVELAGASRKASGDGFFVMGESEREQRRHERSGWE